MNIIEKAEFVGTVFVGGAKAQLEQKWTWGFAAVIGLSQGLKYKGDFKNGLACGAVVLGVISGINGVSEVVRNWNRIQNVFNGVENDPE